MHSSPGIFFPVIALALWTGVILSLTAYRRIGAVRAKKLKPSAFRLGESADVPPYIAVCNRNFVNLLEMPVLFYVVSVSLFVTHNVDRAVLILAWAFVGFRVFHSLVHVTSNHILARFVPFAMSNLVLLGMWILFAIRLA